MNKIDLNNLDVITSKESSSKGNQPKYLFKNYWYKADHMGYEGAVEVVVSNMLKKSNINNFVEYFPVIINSDNKEHRGCFSKNFKMRNTSLITLEHLYRAYTGKSLASVLATFKTAEERIKYTVDFVEQEASLKNVGKYFTQLLEIDAFFLNEDRHTNNVTFIRNEDTKEFSFCPYFDFGLSLISDINDYPLDKNIDDCIEKVKAKPFSNSFDEQLEAANHLYGDYLKFNFSSNDIENTCNDLAEYYDEKIITRVKEVIYRQKHKYIYMFN